ncbi:MAG: 5'/3'-nucleotidase SurE [Rikenellaceae bacterium]
MERLIFVTNDDGYDAPGLAALIEVASKFGRVVAVAPKEPQSGKSQSITTYSPLYLDTIYKRDGVELYALNGTPVDCTKYALDYLLLGQRIDLVVSGINHGSNAGVNILYSGTMGAAIEGGMYAAPAIGFSHINHSLEIDLEGAKFYASHIIESVLAREDKELTILNVNVPDLPMDEIKGMRVVRQNRGYWLEEFFARKDPRGKDYYWLTGGFVNLEPDATDTDIAAIESGYVAVVPVQVDMTDYAKMESTSNMMAKIPTNE